MGSCAVLCVCCYLWDSLTFRPGRFTEVGSFPEFARHKAHSPPLASQLATHVYDGKPTYTNPSSTFTGKTEIFSSVAFRHSPLRRENVLLWKGHATFGSSPADPIMPRERIICFLWGHRFWQAYHSFLLEKLNTAICWSLCFIHAPPFSGKSVVRAVLSQRVFSFAGDETVSLMSLDNSMMNLYFLFQSAGIF